MNVGKSKNILIISVTSRNNLILAKELEKICLEFNISKDLINLEEFNIPIYTPIEHKKSVPSSIPLIMKKFIKADGFIICAPEYNGSIPPILTNIIAWLSVFGKDWRFVFNEKIALIATHSGGSGFNLLQSLRIQLNHLGLLVLPKTIIVNSTMNFNIESSKEKLTQMFKLL